jgi:hypothetical protein
MTLECERDRFDDAHRGEKAPAAHQTGLSRRKPHVLDVEHTAVMEDNAMDHSIPRIIVS